MYEDIIPIGTWIVWSHTNAHCKVHGHEYYDRDKTVFHRYTLELENPVEYIEGHTTTHVWAHPSEVSRFERKDKVEML